VDIKAMTKIVSNADFGDTSTAVYGLKEEEFELKIT
jgi:hypothetical protein